MMNTTPTPPGPLASPLAGTLAARPLARRGIARMVPPAIAAAMMAAMGGCAHRVAVGTVSDWYHHYEGGEIARQRPPPPGAHEAYPRVGLTPTTPPDVLLNI